MTDNRSHPVTPPPELVREWQIKIEYCSKRADREAFVTQVFQLGADAELEACCEWADTTGWKATSESLRATRRPKPPSLKDEVRDIIECLIEGDCVNDEDAVTLRRAFESLTD